MTWQNTPRGRRLLWLATAVALAFVVLCDQALSQTGDNEKDRARALELSRQGKMIEALPLLEKAYAANPKDVVIIEQLALAHISVASTATDDSVASKALSRARKLALQAKELGDESNLVKTMLERLPEDGMPSKPGFSTNKEVNDAMAAAESAFAKGDFEHAVAGYQRALELEPKLYEAALFSGDAYFRLNQLEKSGEAYSKAIAIDPNRETAYRYWADVLVKSNRLSDARLKLIEALIAEPYNRSVYMGLDQWARGAGVRPGHPQINVPAFKAEPGSKATIDISLNPDETDGSSAWMFYSIARATWLDGKSFAKAYPKEKTYRHSLTEETEALRVVVEAVGNLEKGHKIKSLNPQLATLKKLQASGLLETYVLLARADAGIAQDYSAYRGEHRDKIRQYLGDYFVPAIK